MSNSNDWQHVGKVKLRTKVQKEKAFKRMPKVKDLDYATAQSLMFQYDDNEMSGEPLADRSNTLKARPKKPQTKVAVTPEPIKKKPDKPRKIKPDPPLRPVNIDHALKKGAWSSQLENKLEQTKKTFADDSTIWFKEISSYLNINLDYTDELLIPNQKRSIDYPMCQASNDITKVLNILFAKDVKKSAVPHLFEQYILAMLEFIARDRPTWGFKLCIQALAHHHPDLCCKDLNQYKNKLATLYNSPKQCAALLWALGQTGVGNSKCGMRVWLELMLPNLQHKSVAQFALPYVEVILNQQKNAVEKLASILNTKDFLEIARCSFGNATAKGSSTTRDRMKVIYPKFAEFVTNSKASSRQTFSALMARPADETQLLSEELSKMCVKCISKDQTCLQLWRDCYAKRLPQSRLLLSHLLNDWEEANRKLPRKEWKITLNAFISTNLDAEARNGAIVNKSDFSEVKQLCEELKERLRESVAKSRPRYGVAIAAIFLAVAALIGGLILSDVKSHGGVWEKSDSFKILEKNGVISATSYGWARLQHVYHLSYNWLSINVPFYYHKVTDNFGPYFKELMSYLYSLIIMSIEALVPVKIWLITNGGLLLHYIAEVLKTGALYFLDCLDVCLVYVRLGAVWLYETMLLFYASIYNLYTGETSWEDVRKTMLQYFDAMRLLFITVLRKVGDYIAPDHP